METEPIPQTLTAEQAIQAIQEKITQIHNAATADLVKLNERWGHQYENVKSMYDLDLEYYHNVARFAWGHRAKQIAMLEIQSLLNDLKTKI